MKKKWLIWSIEHNAWWAPDENGYTSIRGAAGRYSLNEAKEILKEANRHTIDSPKEAMIPDE